MLYLCTRNTTTGCSAVRLAHLVWDQRVPGSNPGTPTKRDKRLSLFFLWFRISLITLNNLYLPLIILRLDYFQSAHQSLQNKNIVNFSVLFIA